MLFVDARQSFFYLREGNSSGGPKMIPILVNADKDEPWQPLLAQRNIFYRGLVIRV